MHPSDAIQIGASCFSFASHDGRTFYFSNLEPFDCHGEGNRPAMLLRVARFARHGIPHRDLQAAFGISRTTVHRALDKLRDRGEAAFHEPRRGRGTSAITGETADAANRLLAGGMSGAATARELGVSVATLNHNRRRGFIGDGLVDEAVPDRVHHRLIFRHRVHDAFRSVGFPECQGFGAGQVRDIRRAGSAKALQRIGT